MGERQKKNASYYKRSKCIMHKAEELCSRTDASIFVYIEKSDGSARNTTHHTDKKDLVFLEAVRAEIDRLILATKVEQNMRRTIENINKGL